MSERLRILHLEDEPDYSELVKGILHREGWEAEISLVDTIKDFLAAIEKGKFDIVLADYTLPTCTGLQALEAALLRCPEIPFLVVSGTIGEQAAIESLRMGATDYVLKQWPERLGPAVRRAVSESQERKRRLQAETVLIRREGYFRALTENSLDVLTILSREGVFQYNSPSIKHVLGYEPDELSGRNAFELVHPDDVAGAARALDGALKYPELRVTHECRYRRRDGTWCHLEVVGQNRLGDPHIAGVVLNSRDVTERKRAEARLLLQSAALESAANAIVIADRAGVCTWANQAFTRLTGYSTEEIMGQNLRMLKSGNHDQAFYRDMWETVLGRRVWRSEMVNRRKDGSLYTEEATITPVCDERGEITHFIAVKQNITARKELELQLRQSQKMDAVGQLAGGVAHDFNNQLVVIGGNAELVLMNATHLNEEARGCLNQVVAASKRAGNLVRQLLAFSRKQVMELQTVSLNAVIGELTKMLKRVIGENIDLQCKCQAQLPFIMADIGMMEQVLVNLVVNARDAMPRGGQLVITTERTTVEKARQDLHSEPLKGEFVRLSVTDNGTGIAPEHLPHIFEPFFTTKEQGKGTGLGLAIVYGIVKQHQGWIDVDTKVGTGTTFKIFLPAIETPEAATVPTEIDPTLRKGTERILLAEDDLAVRMLTERILGSSGYRVWASANGREAVQLWRRLDGQIDLLLTDMVMPDGMTGRELAEQLQAERPQLKVLFVTGYSPELAGRDTEFTQRNKDYILQKPYPAKTLLRKLRECLEQR